MKNRDQEALRVLSLISYDSVKEYFVDTYLELEDLREARRAVNGNVLSHVLKCKYFTR